MYNLLQEASRALPDEILDAVPEPYPLPSTEFDIEKIPERPENFLPLGSEGRSVGDEILDEMKAQANLVRLEHADDHGQDKKDDLPVADEQHLNDGASEPWNGRNVTKGQTCVSAS